MPQRIFEAFWPDLSVCCAKQGQMAPSEFSFPRWFPERSFAKQIEEATRGFQILQTSLVQSIANQVSPFAAMQERLRKEAEAIARLQIEARAPFESFSRHLAAARPKLVDVPSIHEMFQSANFASTQLLTLMQPMPFQQIFQSVAEASAQLLTVTSTGAAIAAIADAGRMNSVLSELWKHVPEGKEELTEEEITGDLCPAPH